MALPDQKESSEMFPDLHPVCLDQLKSALKFYPEVWFHGDGNIFLEDHNSKNRVEFRNETDENFGGGYRKLFKKGDTIPATLAEMEKQLVAAHAEEVAAARAKATVQANTGVRAIPREDDKLKPKTKAAIVNNEGLKPADDADKKAASGAPPPPPDKKDDKPADKK